jgi:hypothetical protein
MTITAAQFTTDFPEFANPAVYPTGSIQFMLNLAYALLNASRWAAQLDIGAELFCAHWVTLEAKNQAQANVGGMPGTDIGPANSKSVDKVSIGFDIQAGINPGASHWNLTNFGTRFVWMMRMFGAGPVQIGAGGCFNDPLASFNAYQGPYWGGIPNPSNC